MKEFAIKKFDIEKYDSILARGLSSGLGEREAQVCIEAAICEALGLPHGDDPGCVAVAVRSFKITLNDSRWSSEKARAEGLRDLGLAQLGSLGVVNDAEFSKRLAEQTIRVLIPKLFRQIFAGGKNLEAAALRCEKEGTSDAASDAARAARAASDAARAACYASAACAKDTYLILTASIALEVLRELKSPGMALLAEVK